MSDSLWLHGHQASQDYSNSCPSSQWCHPTISSSVIPFSSFSLSQHQGLSNESVLHMWWPKYWSFSFSISPSNEYSGLIYFRMDRLNLLEVKGTLKTLLQNHSLKDQLFDTAFFIVQLSHPHITNGKSIALTRQSFVGKVMFLLFNMLFGHINMLGWS